MPNAVDGVLRVVPRDTALVLTKEEADAMLEIAFLAIAADRTLRDEEIEAFRGVAGRLRDLRGGPAPAGAANPPHDVGDRELERILESFSADMDRAVADERLRVVAAAITRPEVRALTYKVAYALALCDLATSDEEFEFDLELVDALDLRRAEVERLEDEVLAAFQEA
jgi:hypothetical protein